MRYGLSCAAILLATAALTAEEARTFEKKCAEGEKWTVTSTRVLSLDLNITDVEKNLRQTTLMTKAEDAYERTAGKVDGGKPSKVTLHWLRERTGNGKDEGAKGTLEGKTVMLDVSGGGLTVTGDDVTPEQKASMRMEEDYEALLPTKPVAVGATWGLNHRDVARFLLDGFPVIPSEKGSGLCTLLSVEKQGGSDIAQVRVDLVLAGASSSGWSMEAEVQGTLSYDLTHGRPVSLRLQGAARVKGEEKDLKKNTVATVEGKGMLSCDTTYEVTH